MRAWHLRAMSYEQSARKNPRLDALALTRGDKPSSLKPDEVSQGSRTRVVSSRDDTSCEGHGGRRAGERCPRAGADRPEGAEQEFAKHGVRRKSRRAPPARGVGRRGGVGGGGKGAKKPFGPLGGKGGPRGLPAPGPRRPAR